MYLLLPHNFLEGLLLVESNKLYEIRLFIFYPRIGIQRPMTNKKQEACSRRTLNFVDGTE